MNEEKDALSNKKDTVQAAPSSSCQTESVTKALMLTDKQMLAFFAYPTTLKMLSLLEAKGTFNATEIKSAIYIMALFIRRDDINKELHKLLNVCVALACSFFLFTVLSLFINSIWIYGLALICGGLLIYTAFKTQSVMTAKNLTEAAVDCTMPIVKKPSAFLKENEEQVIQDLYTIHALSDSKYWR